MGVVPHRYCLLWDGTWPEWLYDSIPPEEIEEEEGIATMQFSRPGQKSRFERDVNAISEAELDRILACHKWVPPELPVGDECPVVFSDAEREERKIAYIRELSRYELKPGAKGKEEELEESELEAIAEHMVLVDEAKAFRAREPSRRSTADPWVRSVVAVQWEKKDEDAARIWAELLEEFKETTFRHNVW